MKHTSTSTHPSLHCYRKHGCRCAPCRAFNAARSRRHAATGLTRHVEGLTHPSRNCYTRHGCRCVLCVELVRAEKRAYRARLRSAAIPNVLSDAECSRLRRLVGLPC